MPEFSVLIPTRNRRISALLSMRSALASRDVDLEVVVADNSDIAVDRRFEDDPRLRILPPEDRVLSMPANWERVVRAARGEWLIILSDKCRLVPGALSTLRRAAGSEHLAVTYCRTYFFQDLAADQAEDPETLWQTPGFLSRPPLPFTRIARSSKQVMKEWLEKADYVDGYRPMFYCTLIHRGIVDSVLRKHASFFVSLAPDVASGLSVLDETETYLDTNVPTTITQFPTTKLSSWSNGFAMASGKDPGKRFLSEFGRDPFASHGLPPTGSAVVMQTLLDYLQLRHPDLPPETRIGWKYFALCAAHEIERYPAETRNRLQLQLLKALTTHDRAAAWVQVKSVIVSRLPRLYELYTRARSRPVPAASAENGANRDLWNVQMGMQPNAPSLADALAGLGKDVAHPTWA